MGPKQEKKSEEKVKSAGIITVRTTRETRAYSVQQALDTRTGEVISAKLAYGELAQYTSYHVFVTCSHIRLI